MSDEVQLSEIAQEYWGHVEKVHRISGKLLKAKEDLRDPDEEEALFIFKTISEDRP